MKFEFYVQLSFFLLNRRKHYRHSIWKKNYHFHCYCYMKNYHVLISRHQLWYRLQKSTPFWLWIRVSICEIMMGMNEDWMDGHKWENWFVCVCVCAETLTFAWLVGFFREKWKTITQIWFIHDSVCKSGWMLLCSSWFVCVWELVGVCLLCPEESEIEIRILN